MARTRPATVRRTRRRRRPSAGRIRLTEHDPALAAALTAALLFLVGGVAGVLWFAVEASRQAENAQRAADDLVTWMSYHDDFHNYLTTLSQRALLMRQTERMRIMLRPYYRQYYAKTSELEILGLEHRKIIDAVRKRDPDRVENIVRLHAMKNVERVAELAR